MDMRPPPAQNPDLSVAAQARAEAKAQLMLRLRAKGLRDLDLLRAIESIPREIFAGGAYAELALRDVAIPLPCGQTMESPSQLAQMLTLLAPQPHCRILEIGSGSGYSTAVLARLGRDVVGVECFQRLALEARGRIERLRIDNVNLLWADGFDISPAIGLFDRILAHGALDRPPPNVLGALGEGGILVAARKTDEAPSGEIVRYSRLHGGHIEAEAFGPCRAQKLLRGLFRFD
jgi:protein-L-isoaspartate(D-aspartate) O-methyltransferase